MSHKEVCFYSFLPPSAIQRGFKEVFRVADDFQTHVILGLVIFQGLKFHHPQFTAFITYSEQIAPW